MPHEAFCFLCEQTVTTFPDGRLREHSPHDPRGANIVGIRRCPGSELSPKTTRMMAAHRALQGKPRHDPGK